ncbi:RNA BINDING PROTEIN [Salix viminalis]|uniref:RNA BINDING PROTEIN n=1 Tax=Salix viminalis TaxID=40686 RepID=A0A9Q0TP68_SALVM|nr:RNA BINDING PROTEIN [Salix viminalis]
MAEAVAPWKQQVLQRGASLYVGDLDPEVTETDLRAAFYHVGPISSLRLCRCCLTGKSLCYSYVNFYSHAQASRALGLLNHTNLKGKPMRIMWCQRDPFSRKTGFANLFVKNLEFSISSSCLESIFSMYGTILSCKVAEENGRSKGFGFVQFDSQDSALAAQTALHDTMLGGKKFKNTKDYNRSNEKLRASNLYVKNLNVDIDDKRLEEVFSAYGKILSAKVMCHNDGTSRQFGFVCFASPEEANKALVALHGVLLEGKILHVAKAQCKKDHHQERHNFSEQNQPQFFYPSNCNIVSSAIHPLHFNFDRPPQLPFLHRPMFCQQFGANFGVQHPFMPQIYQQKFSTYMPTAEIFLGSKFNTRDKPYQQHSLKFATSNFSNRDLKLGSAGGQKLDSKKKGGKRGAAGENISTGSPSTKCLPAAKSTDSTVINFGNLLQPIVKKLQETHQKALGNDQIECH